MTSFALGSLCFAARYSLGPTVWLLRRHYFTALIQEKNIPFSTIVNTSLDTFYLYSLLLCKNVYLPSKVGRE